MYFYMYGKRITWMHNIFSHEQICWERENIIQCGMKMMNFDLSGVEKRLQRFLTFFLMSKSARTEQRFGKVRFQKRFCF